MSPGQPRIKIARTSVSRERTEKRTIEVAPSASLGTSPRELYCLLDPTSNTKSLRQLMALLYLLGGDVEVKERRPRAAS